MRGCLTTIVFLLITSGLSTFMLGSAFFIAVLLDPDAPSMFELQWHTNVILLVYLIVFIKIRISFTIKVRFPLLFGFASASFKVSNCSI